MMNISIISFQSLKLSYDENDGQLILEWRVPTIRLTDEWCWQAWWGHDITHVSSPRLVTIAQQTLETLNLLLKGVVRTPSRPISLRYWKMVSNFWKISFPNPHSMGFTFLHDTNSHKSVALQPENQIEDYLWAERVFRFLPAIYDELYFQCTKWYYTL